MNDQLIISQVITMPNLSEDIQCAGSDTRPPMLDKADFASWQQRIRLYCRGKDNGVNILKSIDEGPFQMGTTRVIVAEGAEGSLNLGPERPRVYSDLSQDEKDRYNADIRATNIILQGLPKDIYSLINHYTDAKDIWDNVKMLLEGTEIFTDDVQPNHVVDSHADYTSDSNMTPYDQYVKDNAVPVVQNNASMVPNDAYVMIDNDVHESDVLSVSHTPQNTVANNLLNAELATYKEQVELYERRARFVNNPIGEQKIDEQLRIVICDRNIKEENLKKELHSVKLQLASTIQHNKLMSIKEDEVSLVDRVLEGAFGALEDDS
ncbi:hypothetical protein Tco_1430194 [Tanacetum coccineum]